jgi:hypothetical protein
VSGNPRGRAKGTKNIWTVLQEEIQAVVAFSENGKATKASKQVLAIKSAVNKAVKGDLRALQLILKLMETHAPADATQTDAEKSRKLAARQETDRQILEMLGLTPTAAPAQIASPGVPLAQPTTPPTQH